jgi:hypothetical protein
MTLSFGLKAPLNFSVFVDFAAAFSSGRLASAANSQIKRYRALTTRPNFHLNLYEPLRDKRHSP